MNSQNQYPRPPRWINKLLEWYCKPDQLEDLQGDLYELFCDRFESDNQFKANLGFLWDVIRSFRPGAIKSFTFFPDTIMLQNYFKIAFRNIQRNRTFTAINVMGLVVGLTASLFIFLWVNDEMSVNQFHKNGPQIHRVLSNMHLPTGEIATWTNVPFNLVKVLEEEYPDVDKTVLMTEVERKLFSVNGQKIRESGIVAGKDLFNVFSFSLLFGDAETVLSDPHSLAISEKTAEKYFGENWLEKAPGQTITLNNSLEYKITGVFEDIPEQSSLKFDFVTPMDEMISRQPWQEHWGNFNFQMYIQLVNGIGLKEANQKIENAIVKHYPSSEAYLKLQPFTDEYLYSEIENGEIVGGRIEYVRILSLV
ncbi:MAG: ABC transporter permease, partial [Bacteroidetes bacterium]|nr:ABC transporter permease [Bacteroidota bacterium]